MLDEDSKGYLNVENVMWFYLALVRQEVVGMSPDTIRRRVGQQLEDMGHANGLVSLRNFKNYLLYQGLTDPQDLENLHARLVTLQAAWKSVKQRMSSIPALAQ